MISTRDIKSSLIAGGVAAGVSFLLGDNVSVPLLGIEMPAYLATGVGVVAGDFIGDNLATFAKRKMNINNPMLNNAISPATTAAVTYLLLNNSVPGGIASGGTIRTLAIGAGSSVAADYIKRLI